MPAITRPAPRKDVMLGCYRLPEIIRRVRRTADMSQRDLARHLKLSSATISDIETGRMSPSLATLQRILRVAAYSLVVVDDDGRLVTPLQVYGDIADLAGRRPPAHLDTILDPEYGEWWADQYGLTAPPETYRRNRAYRDYVRRLSRWQVRVAQLRNAPMPTRPKNDELVRANGQEWTFAADADSAAGARVVADGTTASRDSHVA